MKGVSLRALSDRVARTERTLGCFLASVIVFLVLLNVVTRVFDTALFWTDELAVYCMIWMAFFGASVLTHDRRHIAVSFLPQGGSRRAQRTHSVLADLIVLAFAVALFVMTLLWFDPIGLARNAFDVTEFTASTFNFVYREPTQTLGIQKFWIWLIVPVFAVTSIIHAAANVIGAFTTKGQE